MFPLASRSDETLEEAELVGEAHVAVDAQLPVLVEVAQAVSPFASATRSSSASVSVIVGRAALPSLIVAGAASRSTSSHAGVARRRVDTARRPPWRGSASCARRSPSALKIAGRLRRPSPRAAGAAARRRRGRRRQPRRRRPAQLADDLHRRASGRSSSGTSSFCDAITLPLIFSFAAVKSFCGSALPVDHREKSASESSRVHVGARRRPRRHEPLPFFTSTVHALSGLVSLNWNDVADLADEARRSSRCSRAMTANASALVGSPGGAAPRGSCSRSRRGRRLRCCALPGSPCRARRPRSR